MEKNMTFSRLEKVVYKFDRVDILNALLKEYQINVLGKKHEFEIYEGTEDNPFERACLTVEYETPEEK